MFSIFTLIKCFCIDYVILKDLILTLMCNTLSMFNFFIFSVLYFRIKGRFCWCKFMLLYGTKKRTDTSLPVSSHGSTRTTWCQQNGKNSQPLTLIWKGLLSIEWYSYQPMYIFHVVFFEMQYQLISVLMKHKKCLLFFYIGLLKVNNTIFVYICHTIIRKVYNK